MRSAKLVIFAVMVSLALAGCAPNDGTLGKAGAASESPVASESASPSESASVSPTATPETRTVTETKRIPYKTRRVNDAGLARGKTRVRVAGVAGVRTLTYKVTFTDGVETDRKLVRQVVTRRPVTRVIAVGTKAARQCDPNYSGCVPVASDVDCAGGSGNGPGYVQGPVRVTGSDIYDLDRDGDGVACD
jgi:resuscitation-promoting factor RpfB